MKREIAERQLQFNCKDIWARARDTIFELFEIFEQRTVINVSF